MKEVKDKEIADFFGVSRQAIYNIKKNNPFNYEIKRLIVELIKNKKEFEKCDCFPARYLLYRIEEIEKKFKEKGGKNEL